MGGSNMLLSVRNLYMWYPIRRFLSIVGYVKAVEDVSFDLDRGEILALVGESGSGKTTVGKVVLRLYKPTKGEILFEGRNIANLDGKELMWYRRQVGYVQQDPYGALPPFMTIKRILEEPLIIHGIKKEERIDRIYKALEEVRLTPVEDFLNKYPHQLSGGQQQRVVIARALILRPKLVVADEPVSMLDASVRVEILTLFRELQKIHNLGIIYITHDLATTKYFSDKIAIMYAGQLVERAPTQDLLKEPLHPYTQALIKAIPDPDPRNRKIFRETPAGEPPSLINPPPGCRFRSRCPFAMDICMKDPIEIEIKKNHYVKCWLYANK
ncbi:oligopeptide/dipeptide ABC transporter, ATPase subunit [Ignisphaera aggregans DSM 17230]|uniref:Oligopeptide/dipeptide ABC transporter, ATPase subunit n=1 Tax=Ignisphaera aggregans (strain DSM 17230 / JCM 13409 / AQ1.S1) TaxID=583356 RepID=E0SNH6_IGNAA|nr:oligopeptide/dipeptide ABC transporter, ATPase subunit [Ignisphaera aggregans DSM 17230]